jgi:hypothetical protein
LIFGLDNINAHQRGFMHFGAIHPKWEAPNEISTKSFQLYYGHPWLAGKRLVRAMQSMQFRAKRLENDLKPTDFQKRNYYFETEAVDWRSGMDQLTLVQISHSKLKIFSVPTNSKDEP